MTEQRDREVTRAIELLSGGLFVMTSAFEDKRAGVVVRSVQPCSDEPLLICVAARKGHWIEPVIRDSHFFAVCLVPSDDKLVVRKFSTELSHYDEESTDPFDSFPTETLVTGSPVLKRSLLALDCEVVRHFDLEADHELYIGQVLAARVYAPE